MANRPQELSKVREQIARKVRELRTDRRLTQQELARRLGVSQGRLSELERGEGSFTAEQLLALLSFFNVPATHFAPQPHKHEQDLQNALARHGAAHLRESTDLVPSERLEELATVVREALIGQAPRQVAALAPVLVRNSEELSVLTARFLGSGLERRWGWVIENTLVAVRQDLPALRRGPTHAHVARSYRRAEVVLETALEWLQFQLGPKLDSSMVELLDPVAVSKRTLDELRASSSPISKRWGIITALQPQDFAEALRDALGRG